MATFFFLKRLYTLNFTLEIITSVGEFVISDRETKYIRVFRKSLHRLTTY